MFGRMGEQLAKKQVKSWIAGAINKVAGITLLRVNHNEKVSRKF